MWYLQEKIFETYFYISDMVFEQGGMKGRVKRVYEKLLDQEWIKVRKFVRVKGTFFGQTAFQHYVERYQRKF